MKKLINILLLPLAFAASGVEPPVLHDKTLVAWVKPANLEQRGSGVLTVEQRGRFDAIVFGEVAARRWMAGSDTLMRTEKSQDAYPVETADSNTVVQVAIVYQGKQVTLVRDGKVYADYTTESQQTFTQNFTVLIGKRHAAAPNPANFAGSVLDARVYNRALRAEDIAVLKVGAPSDPKPFAWWCFIDAEPRDRMGNFKTSVLKNGARVENGGLVLDGRGALLAAAIAGPVQQDPLLTEPIPEEVVRTARLLRERMLADPYRPGYHFVMSEDLAIPGDPNGAFYHNGRYHLMYLYARRDSGFCWGHISSKDLVHWRNHPDALAPDDGFDTGIFSGGAFVDDDGTAYLSYWKLGQPDGIGIAKSGDPDFNAWSKSEANPVIRSTEFGLTEAKGPDGQPLFYGSADPSNIWKKDGRYYMLTGNLLVLNKIGRKPDAPLSEQGDRLYLCASDDLKSWKYLHVFYDRKPEWTDRSEDNMCPSFLPLPASAAGGPPSGKHLLLFIAHNRGCQYYVGDYRDDKFYPNNHGRMSWVDNTYFAPEALVDGQGRQIMWAWLTDNPPGEKEKGWSGVYGLPRSLWVGEDGSLRMAPVKELETLRCLEKTWSSLTLADGETKALEGLAGDSCELAVEIEVGTAQRCGLKVRAAPGGEEETLLYYDAEKRELVFDATRSGGTGRKVVERAPFALKPGEPLKLRVFVDKSVVEVYANERQAIARRVYPVRNDSLGVSLFAGGGTAKVREAKAWRMAPSNPY